jgi:AraC-like DNA-binding protein
LSRYLASAAFYADGMGPPDIKRLISLRGARDLIDRDFAAQVNTTALAAQAGYSRYHFIRAFRAAYGATPGEYLSRRRIERARDLLRTANLTVTEVCFLVGFSSLGSFSSRFSELTGCPPSEYQRRARTHGGPPPIPGCMALMWGAATGRVRNNGEAQAAVASVTFPEGRERP